MKIPNPYDISGLNDLLKSTPLPDLDASMFDDLENPFSKMNLEMLKLNAMILAVVELLTPEQRAAFPDSYARKLSELHLSIASSNQEDE